MNLKVYTNTPVLDDNGVQKLDEHGKPVVVKTEKTLHNLRTLNLEFDRNMWYGSYHDGRALVHAEGELSSLYKDELAPESLFTGNTSPESGVGHLVDPTTVPTSGLTGNKDSDRVTKTGKTELTAAEKLDAELKRLSDKDKPHGHKEQPKSFDVKSESAVGHLIDPGTSDTGKLKSDSTLKVPNAAENKQGTTKFEIKP